MKGLGKGPMSRQALKKIISKFEESVLQGNRQKQISNETAEEGALVVERASDFQYYLTRVQPVPRD